jgi:outer membrane protein assembly factor BamB
MKHRKLRKENRRLERKAVSVIMLTLLLVSLTHLAAVTLVASALSSNGDLLNYGVFSGTEDWWWMFHHDLNHTGNSTSVVHEYIESLWNCTTGGGVRCSPAVVDGKVFVGSEDGYVYALNASTGQSIKNSSNISAVDFSSPAVTGGTVFVGSINGRIYALNETTLETIWNFTTGGPVESSPAVANNTVFVGSNDTRVYALNATDGKQIWNYTTKGPVRSSSAVAYETVFVGSEDGYVYALNQTNSKEIWRFRTADPVRSSPAVVDGRVFVGVNDGRVYALNATTGKYLWHFETGDAVESSPAVADGVVFVGSNDTRVYALNATDGTQIWNYATGGPVISSPAIAVDKVFLGSNDTQIYALNVTDGSKIWNFTTGGPVVSSPAIFEGKVYVGSLDKNVYAFQANKPPQAFFDFYPTSPIVTQMVTLNASTSYDPDGNITSYTWSFGDGTPQLTETDPITNHTYNMGGTYNATLTVRDNFKPFREDATWHLITVGEAWPMFHHDLTHAGYSTSWAPVKNDTLWNLTIGPNVTGDPWMYPSPTVVGDVIFMISPSPSGTVYAVGTNGTVIWSKTPAIGWRIYSSPAVSDNLVFVGCDNGYVYALNVANGDINWSTQVSALQRTYSSPVVANNKVFVGSSSERVYAIDKNTGTILKTSPSLGGAIDSSPAVAYGRVFVGSFNGSVYALDEETLDIIWNYATGGPVSSSPTVASDTVFIGSEDHNLYALDATTDVKTGVKIWNNSTNDKVDSSPAVAYGKVFVGSHDNNTYAYNAATGQKIWNKAIGSVGWSSPAVAEGKVFIGSTNGEIYALYEESGDIVWSYQTGGPVDSSPTVLNDTLYVGSKDGNIYAFSSQVHDIGVTNVSVSPSLPVPRGIPMNITVTIRNEGTFNETNINVTAYYSNSTFTDKAGNITIPSLARGTKITELIQWDTTNVAPGGYNISAVADTVPGETDTADNTLTDGLVTIQEPGLRNIKLTNVVLFKTVVGQGYSMNVTVTVEDQGAYSLTFNVAAYYNDTVIILPDGKNYMTINLTGGESKSVTFTWNTTGFAKGNYTISAYAWPVPGETDTADNNFTDGWVIVSIVGDITSINGYPDGRVGLVDVYAVALAFGSMPGYPNWGPVCDINNDGTINLIDYYTVCLNFGNTDP